MSRPSLSETMSEKEFYKPRQNPEQLSSKKQIIYEIEKLLMEDKNLKIDFIDNRSRHNRNISNIDLYKILKAVCMEMNVRPRIVYTGGDVLDMNQAEDLVSETGKNLEDLEPSL